MKKGLCALLCAISFAACEDSVTPVVGVMEVATVTNGAVDADGYSIAVDGVVATSIAANGATALELTEGSHTVELTDIAEPCTVVGENPVTVDVTSAATTTITLTLTC